MPNIISVDNGSIVDVRNANRMNYGKRSGNSRYVPLQTNRPEVRFGKNTVVPPSPRTPNAPPSTPTNAAEKIRQLEVVLTDTLVKYLPPTEKQTYTIVIVKHETTQAPKKSGWSMPCLLMPVLAITAICSMFFGCY